MALRTVRGKGCLETADRISGFAVEGGLGLAELMYLQAGAGALVRYWFRAVGC